eukprot:5078538-Pyramimonas_sp.AAC.1
MVRVFLLSTKARQRQQFPAPVWFRGEQQGGGRKNGMSMNFRRHERMSWTRARSATAVNTMH